MNDFRGKSGIVYVAFGEQYAKVCSVSAASARQTTGLPIHVLTNLPDAHRTFSWPRGTTFDVYERPDEDNRLIRVRLDELTPFARTMLCDADIWFADTACPLPFAYLEHWDAVMVSYRSIRHVHKKNATWAAIADGLGSPDHSTLCGGLFWFRKTQPVHHFFRLWRRYWEADGRGRDMPALFRAYWHSELRACVLPGENEWIGVANGHFRHAAGAQSLPQLPNFVKFKPNERNIVNGRPAWERITRPGQ